MELSDFKRVCSTELPRKWFRTRLEIHKHTPEEKRNINPADRKQAARQTNRKAKLYSLEGDGSEATAHGDNERAECRQNLSGQLQNR